jgi:hypothetical protein
VHSTAKHYAYSQGNWTYACLSITSFRKVISTENRYLFALCRILSSSRRFVFMQWPSGLLCAQSFSLTQFPRNMLPPSSGQSSGLSYNFIFWLYIIVFEGHAASIFTMFLRNDGIQPEDYRAQQPEEGGSIFLRNGDTQ